MTPARMTDWAPPVAVAAALLVPYLVALRRRPGTLPDHPRWRTAAWVCGAVLAAVAITPPMTALAHHDHRAHMTQHLVLGMYAPVALVAGAPLALALGSMPQRTGRAVSRVLRTAPVRAVTHPLTAAVLAVGVLFVLYLTPLYELSHSHAGLRWLILLHFLLAGYAFAWSIAGVDPAPHRSAFATRLAVLVVAAGAHSFLAKLLYARTTSDPHAHLGSLADAAQWMYYGGDAAEILLATMLFATWYRRREPVSDPPRPGRLQHS
ncbi:cytochrome c oxidase assembly protein [Cellulomonas sp. P22]|uniref:cytochrome c oxidase assembly protein n=1 Tax=Cellulomonas sp. P22 TaxID=3373189 RepID=UPI00379CDB05